MTPRFDIAIVGGGAAGTLAAIQFLRQAGTPLRIALFEPGPHLAAGVAYATTRGEHLLNVATAGMSALPDQPGDFLDWACARPGHAAAARAAQALSFAPRREYASYLRERLAQARQDSPARLEVLPWRIHALARDDDGWLLTAGDAGARARRVLLAVGNSPRPLPANGAADLPGSRLVDAWDYDAVAAIGADEQVCIVGTGLSMADVLLTLSGNGHRGLIHLLSRHALLPLPHSTTPAANPGFEAEPLLAMPLRARLRALRQGMRAAALAGLPWQSVMERLRPHGQALWRSLPQAEQRRFLRHAVRHWDIHRHRIAPSVHAVLQELRDDGRLHVHRARLDSAMATPRGASLAARRHDGDMLRLEVDRIVNATGLELRARSMRNPLLARLLDEGHVRPGAHGLGLDADGHGRLSDAGGHAQDDLRTIGSLRIGEAWESIAVPELRVQAADIARAWVGASP